MNPPSIVRTSTAELYDANVLKNSSRAALTLVRGRGAQVPGKGLLDPVADSRYALIRQRLWCCHRACRA